MGRKRQDREPSPDLPPICRRIDWLLKHVWANNMTQMARDLGVSQTAVARVLSGQIPSGKMLESLAGTAWVNVRWLLTGQGQETLGQVGAVSGALWPVVITLLPGRPADWPELAGCVTLPAASPYLLESAYWLKVTSEMPVAASATLGVAAGDYLLVEAAERWTRRPEAYLGRIIALRLPEDKGFILAKCERESVEFEEIPQYDLKTFGVCKEARLFPLIARETAQRNQLETVTGGPGLVRFFGDEVVGVVLQRMTFLEP